MTAEASTWFQQRNKRRYTHVYRIPGICTSYVICTSKRSQSPLTLMRNGHLASCSYMLSRVHVCIVCRAIPKDAGYCRRIREITMPRPPTCFLTCIPARVHAIVVVMSQQYTARMEAHGPLSLLPLVALQHALSCSWQASAFEHVALHFHT